MDGTKNLMAPRGDKSVWDKPSLSISLSNYDQQRWLTAAGGSVLMMVGARRGGFAGGFLAMLGTALTIRAAMGRHDLQSARRWVDRTTTEFGWRARDVVSDASEESFPASDSPSWTGSGATPQR